MELIRSLIILILFASCSTIPVPLDTTLYYRNDMSISVDGESFTGVGILRKNVHYKIIIESREDIDVLTISSCHRNIIVESAIKTGWFRQKRSYQFDFYPDPIEQDGACPLRFGGYSKASGQNSWGILSFVNDNETLSAKYECDGYSYTQEGSGVCQSKEGLIQSITFSVEVRIAKNAISEKCQIPESKDGKTWIFPLPSRECYIAFSEIKEPYRLHKALLVGYQIFPIRGN